ncbi:MAG: isoaspartyl peptidase/L-asparaginase [Acidobacteria bacterium]|nr:isoaspartyl peptidase/L-asparaginase [Acidobacteriota bacterium]
MSKNGMKRREFLKNSAAAGLAAPLLTGESISTNPTQQPARPIVISSANINRTPKGEVFNGGLACVSKAMEIIKAGGDTLDAVVAGVNIVEDDPRDSSVGYGGLPNEEGDVELDSSVMHGPTHRAGAVAAIRNIKNPSKVAKTVLERTDHILLVGEGALRFALKQGFKREDLLTEESRKAWLAWKENLNQQDAWGPSPLKTAGSTGGKVSRNLLSNDDIALNNWIEDKLRNRPPARSTASHLMPAAISQVSRPLPAWPGKFRVASATLRSSAAVSMSIMKSALPDPRAAAKSASSSTAVIP